MKKSFLTLAAIALVLSFTSCKDESSTEVEVIEEIEAPIEVMETPSEEVMDSTVVDSVEVEANMTETTVN